MTTGDFLQNKHLVYSLNVIRLWLKRTEVLDVLVLWLQGVVEHLQSCSLVVFCEIPAGQRRSYALESVLFAYLNKRIALQESGEKGSSQQVVQAQKAHASEISFGIAALKTNFTPLFGDAAAERCVGTQLFPQLQHKQTTDQGKTVAQ